MAEKSLPKEISITVHEDEKSATVKVGNRTTSMVVPVLALFKNAEGKITQIYFRSKFHRDKDEYFGWSVSGARTTTLTRI